MSVVVVLWIILTIGLVAVAIAGLVAWRQRLRESLPTVTVPLRPFILDGERHDHAADRGIHPAASRTPRVA